MSPTTALGLAGSLAASAFASAAGGAWAVAGGASPSPSPLPQLEPTQVSPGLAGFLAIFAVALACVVLFFALSRQLRRMRHNAEVQGVGRDGPAGADVDATDSGAGDAGATDGGATDAGPRGG